MNLVFNNQLFVDDKLGYMHICIYTWQHNCFTNSTWNNMALHWGQNSWTTWVLQPIKTKSYSQGNPAGQTWHWNSPVGCRVCDEEHIFLKNANGYPLTNEIRETFPFFFWNSNFLINWQGWKLLCSWPRGCEVSWNITQAHILGIATENPRHGQLIGGSILENNHPHQNPLKSCQIL